MCLDFVVEQKTFGCEGLRERKFILLNFQIVNLKTGSVERADRTIKLEKPLQSDFKADRYC